MQNGRLLSPERLSPQARQSTAKVLLLSALLLVGVGLIIVGVRGSLQALDWLCERDVFPPMFIMSAVSVITMILFDR
ncbi:hypothetical protein HK11_10740 [Acetobacter sp. DmW_043]|nr:hypothetical protein HK11_10740 [Acetobacter sp. DmW_043]OUJ05186.1 hypothetical protein HK25_06520 [Acetobacter sp. DsW_059]